METIANNKQLIPEEGPASKWIKHYWLYGEDGIGGPVLVVVVLQSGHVLSIHGDWQPSCVVYRDLDHYKRGDYGSEDNWLVPNEPVPADLPIKEYVTHHTGGNCVASCLTLQDGTCIVSDTSSDALGVYESLEAFIDYEDEGDEIDFVYPAFFAKGPLTADDVVKPSSRSSGDLFRIGVVGTKKPNRQYISSTNGSVCFSGRDDALHWNKTEAKILTDAFNNEFARLGRSERFQIERSC